MGPTNKTGMGGTIRQRRQITPKIKNRGPVFVLVSFRMFSGLSDSHSRFANNHQPPSQFGRDRNKLNEVFKQILILIDYSVIELMSVHSRGERRKILP